MKNMRRLAITLILIASIAALVFIQVPTKQGVNYQVHTYRIPLYIKIIEFIDRDYQYRRIVSDITAGKATGKEKALAIFNWCVENIKHKPEGLPVVDDHPLNIIIRGYGVRDQFEDIFTILCTYAGFEAFYKEIHPPAGEPYYISFVKIGDQWHIFSVSSNAYSGKISNDPSALESFKARIPGFDPDHFIKEVQNTPLEASKTRVRGQSPIGRLICIIKGYK